MICARCGRSVAPGGRCVCGFRTDGPESQTESDPSNSRLDAIERELAGVRRQLGELSDLSRTLQQQLDSLKGASVATAPLTHGVRRKQSEEKAPAAPRPPAAVSESTPVRPPTFSAAAKSRPRERLPSILGGSRRQAREWELLVGGNWLSKIGVAAIFLGALYFLKYAFDHQWIGNTGRVLIGVVAGLLLLYGGEYFQRRGYAIYGQSLSGGGVAVLYLAIYAASNFYSLIPRTAAFGWMALVTLACGLLAYRHHSKTLAVLGLLGGILTPYWLRSGENQQIGLLSYLLILDVGFGVPAYLRNWLFLNWLSFTGTVVLFGGWALQHYTSDALVTTQLFLTLFAVTYLALSEFARRRSRAGLRRYAGYLAGITVVLFFFASQELLSERAAGYWSFLVLFSLAVLGFGTRRSNLLNEGWLMLVAVGLLIWVADGYRLEDRALALIGSLTLFLMVTGQGLLRQKLKVAEAGRGDFRISLLSGLGFFGFAYLLLSDSGGDYLGYGDYLGLFAIGQGIFHLLMARVVQKWSGPGRLLIFGHVAAAVTLAALAVPIQLEQNWVTIGWAFQAVVLVQIGFSVRWEKLRWAAWALLSLSLLRLLILDAWEPIEHHRVLWNSRSFTFLAVIAATYFLAWIYQRQELPENRMISSGERIVDGLLALAGVLTVLTLSLEAWSHYAEGLRQLQLALAREELSAADYAQRLQENRMGRLLGLSLIWAGYSVVTCLVGILRGRPMLRLFGIALFFLTIAKVFWLDIWTLRQFYRILSVVGLGVLLLIVAFLYQRYRGTILGSTPSEEDKMAS